MGLLASLSCLAPQKLLFSDFSSTPQEHTEKELSRYTNRVAACPDGKNCPAPPEPTPSEPTRKRPLGVLGAILIEQCANAFIVGGVAFFSTLAASQGESVSLKAAGIAFGMTFFFELRKYRKL